MCWEKFGVGKVLAMKIIKKDDLFEAEMVPLSFFSSFHFYLIFSHDIGGSSCFRKEHSLALSEKLPSLEICFSRFSICLFSDRASSLNDLIITHSPFAPLIFRTIVQVVISLTS